MTRVVARLLGARRLAQGSSDGSARASRAGLPRDGLGTRCLTKLNGWSVMTEETATLVRLGDTDLTLAIDADDARGRTVLDRNGEEVGEVEGLIIDRDERRVRFLQVAAGGFLGMGKQKLLVPVDAVTGVDDKYVHVDKDREHVAGGPVYDPDLTFERTYVGDLYGYYGYTPFWGAGYMNPAYPFR